MICIRSQMPLVAVGSPGRLIFRAEKADQRRVSTPRKGPSLVAHVGHEEVERIERKQRLHHLGVTYFQLESVAVLEAAASSE